MKKFSKIWAIVYTAAILSFSTYAVLDTFVISKVYSVVDESAQDGSDPFTSVASAAEVGETKDNENTEDIKDVGTLESAPDADDNAQGSVPDKILSGEGKKVHRKSKSFDGSMKSDSGKSSGTGKTSGQNSGSSTKGSVKDSDINGAGGTSGAKAADSADTSGNKSASGTTADITADSTGETQIEITEYREYETTIYVADIYTVSAGSIRTAFASNAYGKNVTAKTSEIAQSVDAVLAINGDFYGAQESGYVIRNGVLYRDTAEPGQEDLVIWQDGSFEIISEEEVTAQELLEQGAWQVLSFGPALLEDGEIAVSENEEVDQAMTSNPRTAIGIAEDGHYVMVVSDGRTDESEGLSLYEMAEFLQSLGIETAYNLDGGGSSTMVYHGTLVNNPTSGHSIKERAVSDIVYIM